ncbi:MAG: DUF3034 family protein [Wenzhouxiangellaceae bacterium]|nr:MAG: DUF3034 family protein [Wenzhouxiangellaceae bacterium]
MHPLCSVGAYMKRTCERYVETNMNHKPVFRITTVLLLLSLVQSAQATGGRLLATGGVTQFEGAGGGGLTPWALITGYGTADEIGGSAHYTWLHTDDYTLHSIGAKIGFFDRFELSLARQRLQVDQNVIAATGGALVGALEPLLGDPGPLSPSGTNIDVDIFGAKVRLFGDAVYAQDSWLPQVSLGAQYKRNRDFGSGVAVPYLGDVGVPALLGAKDSSGIDYYLSATKVFLGVPFGYNLIVNGTLRATRANAFGLLGFGREVVNPLDGELLDRSNSYRLEYEASVGLFVHPNVVIGAEYRTQSNRLADQPVLGLLGAPDLAREDNVYDLFLAWIPNKNVALTAAWVDLGNLPFQPRSRAAYLSLQLSY